jgi:hypothetical protein
MEKVVRYRTKKDRLSPVVLSCGFCMPRGIFLRPPGSPSTTQDFFFVLRFAGSGVPSTLCFCSAWQVASFRRAKEKEKEIERATRGRKEVMFFVVHDLSHSRTYIRIPKWEWTESLFIDSTRWRNLPKFNINFSSIVCPCLLLLPVE